MRTTPIGSISEDELFLLRTNLAIYLVLPSRPKQRSVVCLNRRSDLCRNHIISAIHHSAWLTSPWFGAGLRPRRGYLDLAINKRIWRFATISRIPQWTSAAEPDRKQILNQRVVVVNPITERAILASITDVGPAHTQRFQFGTPPWFVQVSFGTRVYWTGCRFF